MEKETIMKPNKPTGFFKRAFIPLVAGFILAFTTNVWAGTTHRVGVDGLACPFCAYGVEKQFRAVRGVRSVSISVKSGIVTVTMKDGAKLSRGRASQAVRNAGFTMRSFR